ncbi:flagellar hook-basal body complex protein FliE [Aestuariibius sp. HNIBRBA575]|uniref:flagellar hook-basal body complex protein FliE n=1 Tax=Aestuariibius sp. HNIBRBA575 TaxID=3233343 RepID=UPI0034A23600
MELGALRVAQQYAANRPATSPSEQAAGDSNFGAAASDFMATLRASEQASMDAMTTGSDPHALVQALAQTELAVETVVTVRDKVVEAYQEILRMPI